MSKKKNAKTQHSTKSEEKRYSWTQGGKSTCFYSPAAKAAPSGATCFSAS